MAASWDSIRILDTLNVSVMYFLTYPGLCFSTNSNHCSMLMMKLWMFTLRLMMASLETMRCLGCWLDQNESSSAGSWLWVIADLRSDQQQQQQLQQPSLKQNARKKNIDGNNTNKCIRMLMMNMKFLRQQKQQQQQQQKKWQQQQSYWKISQPNKTRLWSQVKSSQVKST